MTKLRWFLLISICFNDLGYCRNSQYYDTNLYTDCFQGAKGWYNIAATCVFPLTQFERNYTTAVQMCGAVNHSIGYRETNWLIAPQLAQLLTNEQNPTYRKMYWTGLVIKDEQTIGVKTGNITDTNLDSISDFTSIFNPLWAIGQPPEDISMDILSNFCIALDFRNSSSYGWRALPCSYQLPILCQNYACLPDTFRCFDNSKCIPGSMKNDGYNDCLDGSDESELTKIPISSSTQNTLLSNILRENPMYVWPMIMSTGGVLSPKTVKYGRGECTHKWTVISPNDKYFMIGLKWTNPTTWTNILIEGKDGNGRIMLNSRNSTTSFSMFSSSFVLTASNTDTRRTDFQMFFQEIDDSLCKISEDNQLLFDSETIPMPCNYHFSTKSPSSYVALLIRKCEGLIPFVSSIQFNNSTVFLAPSSLKKILIIPSNSLDIHVNSTWPGTDTKLDIQFFELAPGEESVDMFLIDSNLEIEWISRSNDICMEGKFRTLTVNMIMTSSVESLKSSIWRTEKFRKSCSEDNVQIISRNLSTFVTDSGVISGFGPTTVIIHQSAEPFEFKSIYSIQQSFPETAGSFLNVIYEELEEATQVSVDYSTTTAPRNSTPCKLPSVTSGYILNVTSTLYLNGTKVYINCEQGFILHPLPYVITCREDGIWTDNTGEQTYGKENPQVECRPITCPGETQVETQTHLVPNNFNINYGAVRHYSNMTNGFGFGPFCICGDYEPTSWQCYNDNWNGTDETFPNACIMPEFNDSVLVSGPYRSVFPDNFVISMKCMLCPSLIKNYTCQNGLWMNSEGHIQPYGTFKCDCSEAGDPCKPHGTYIQHVGFYSCDCDKGYKFGNGTCVDIDECQEQSDYCDRGIYSSCNNTIGGFNCPCSPNYHTYYKDSTDYSQWGSIERSLIEGYSCIETTCAYSDNWNKDKLNVTGPPLSYWYQSGTPVGDFYAQDVCGDRCVIRFKVSCQDTTLYSVPDGLRTCPEIDTDIFDIQTGNQLTKVFGTAVLSCKRGQLLIGRPKVFCNSTAQWEIMPICIYQSCSNLKQFVHWPLYIANISSPNSGFEYETTVYFGCDLYGYTLYGPGSITCVLVDGNYDWSEPLPTCIQTTSTVFTTPSTSEISTGTRTYFAEASTPSTSQFPWATTRTSPITGGSTKPTQLPIFQDDVVIEGSMILEETNILHRKELWTQTADWIWTSSNCIIHQWTFPISFLVTSTPFELNSDEIELLIDISQCNSSVQVAISTSIDGFIPPISDFRPILNTTSSGSFVVKLRNLKSFLALSITANGFVQICGVIIRENMCDEVDFNGLHFASSKPFSMRRYLLATCGNRIAPINGYCDSQKGWVVQNKPCLCNTKPSCVTSPLIPQRDQFALCDLNSCRNGECQQLNGTFSCICNEYFISDTRGSESYCKPNNCQFTSSIRNSGYNCETGEEDTNSVCPNTGFSGDFCQYSGDLEDDNYVYILENGAANAIATYTCGRPETSYAIPNSKCGIEDIPCPAGDPCKYTCVDGSDCTRDFFHCGASCSCGPNLYGRSCDVYKNCFDVNDKYICLNGGTCILDGINTRCNCTSHFNGAHCEIALDDENCLDGENKCENGSCRRENDEVYCNCNNGFIRNVTGLCTVEWDMCQLNKPCQQNGLCNFNVDTGKLNCDCTETPGWHGQYCEKEPKYDDCTVCVNSDKCYDEFTSNVRCQCSVGFSGDHCTDPIDDCPFEPCLNGGTCNPWQFTNPLDNVESYNCTCPSGYSGTNCEIRICEKECQNGGTCYFSTPDTTNCSCLDQFYGTYCEKNCESYCLNSIGCSVNKNGTINCECENGFSDDRCDRVNVCEAHILVCQNSGTCNTETQKCDCPDLFNGTYCEQNLNKCETNSIFCENGGSCIKETGKCECPDNYTGDLCENQIIKCDNITCYNGGTCRNGSCVCLPGTTGDFCEDFGQPCMIVNPNGTISPYCLNGICYNLPTGASCDCDGTEFTGRRCETKSFVNFNLVFNGLDYVPDIVTHQFYNSSVAQFTLCSFVQYNHPTADSNQENSQNVTLPPFLTFRGLENNSQQIVFDNNGFFICDGDKKCNRDNYPFTPTPITANTWHHFCLVSPLNLTSPTYFVYLDGIRQPDQRATAFNSILTVYLQLAPSYLSEKRFEGMISMTELYSVRLSDSEIGQLAFNCNATLNTSGNKPFITWNDFTRVSSSNPGVYIDPAGICNSVKCMFGRQIGKTNCDVDRISPTVLKCPSRQQRSTTNDFIKVNWPDEEISFFDNIGVTRIEANYQNGQQFGIGITAIRYVAFDAAENSAECTFDVVVVQRGCPTENQTYVEGGTRQFISSNAPFASKVAKVQCNDVLYPVENRPRFYVCDIMGYYNYGGWIEGNTKKYYLPSCGKTFPALQKLNGTVVGSGSCQQVAQKLRDVINATVNCNQIKCNITTTQCNQTTNIFWNSRENENSSYPIQYWFSTSNSTETVSSVILQNLQSSFSVVRQDSNIECNPSFPIQNRNGNVTVCVSCPMGTYANTKLNKCMDCPFNTYRNSTDQNQLSCVQCPENTITGDVIGAVDISQCYRNCDEGEYESRGNCLPCPIGTYSPTRGLRKCICCEFDSSTDDTGKRSIEDCSVFCGSGQEMIRNGTSSPYCQDCSFGFYKVGERGACIQCPRGLTTNKTRSTMIEDCSQLNCIDLNTMLGNMTNGTNTHYSELCVSCEHGTFQNQTNQKSCLQCSDFNYNDGAVPITCQANCYPGLYSDDVCSCDEQPTGSIKIQNCLPQKEPDLKNFNAIKIVLPVVFGVLLIIVVVVLFCFRKQIMAWFRKTDTSGDQHVPVSHWPEPPTIPRPGLRIVTSREEMDQLPPLRRSTSSIQMDLRSSNFPSANQNSSRRLGSPLSTELTFISSDGRYFEANGSPKIQRGTTPIRSESVSDDSMLDSFF